MLVDRASGRAAVDGAPRRAAWTSRRWRRGDPEAILKEPVEPAAGFQPFQARKLAFGLGIARRGRFRKAGRLPAVAVPRLRGHRRVARRGQPVPAHAAGEPVGARREGHLRRQRALPPSGVQGAARLRRGGPARGGGLEARPQLHQARGRQRRLHGERRRPRDGHDGHHQARRRQPGQLPGRGRRRQRGPDPQRLPHPAGRPGGEGGPDQHLRRHPALRRAGRGRDRRRARPARVGAGGRAHEGQQRGDGQADAALARASTSSPWTRWGRRRARWWPRRRDGAPGERAGRPRHAAARPGHGQARHLPRHRLPRVRHAASSAA